LGDVRGLAHEALVEYQRIDVALDPFPFSRGATSCDALWMGVPVVRIAGATFAGRHSLGHLSNVGLAETIAADRQQCVEWTVGLADDLSRWAAICAIRWPHRRSAMRRDLPAICSARCAAGGGNLRASGASRAARSAARGPTVRLPGR
jgi:hypothetical protein